jgi:hypothetical protein
MGGVAALGYARKPSIAWRIVSSMVSPPQSAWRGSICAMACALGPLGGVIDLGVASVSVMERWPISSLTTERGSGDEELRRKGVPQVWGE